MGFGKFFKRMVTGEPVFQAQDVSSAPEKEIVSEKIIPEVYIDRESCNYNSDIMSCDAYIYNDSKQIVFLDEIHIFGKKMELQRQLEPGERREFQIYNGPKVFGNYIQECRILYRSNDGDYFASIHDVDCKQQDDGSQMLTRIRFLPPIKDV